MDIGLAFFVYTRPKHTAKVVETIKKNKFKNIYVFQDGLKKESQRENWEEVSRIIETLREDSSVNVEVHKSDKNKGLARSIIFGVSYVFERHEAVIALEDDVVLSKDYCDYANRCFDLYKDDQRVMSICGSGISDAVVADKEYMDGYPYDVYFSPRMSSVAFGTWRDRWAKFQYGKEYAKKILTDFRLCNKITRNAGKDLLFMLDCVVSNPDNIDTWATFWCVMQAVADGVTVVPVKALAKDIGRDGTGTNTKEETDRFKTTLHDLDFMPKLPVKDDVIVGKL